MNELFFSALFIGSLLFGNSENKEIPTAIQHNEIQYMEAQPKGKLELISNSAQTFTFQVLGDQTNDSLKVFVDNQEADARIENGQLTINRPENLENNAFQVDLKTSNNLSSNTYASYVISF